MARVEVTESGVAFRGTVDQDRDLTAAAGIARGVREGSQDDEDEDPLGGARSCFGCRYRRWVPDGFTCLRDVLSP